jgi:tetratricopeptide (TPR) repeat protein
MRWLVGPAVSVSIVVWSSGVGADDKRDCLDGMDQDLRIKRCSAVIDLNPNDAIAYYTRAVAYQFNGDLDRAISDYSKAIELNPYHAAAYDSRARAYASKGDYIKAVTDVMKASGSADTSTPEPKKISAEEHHSKIARVPQDVKAVTHTSVTVAAGKSERKEALDITQGPVGTWPPWASYGKR